MIDENSFEYKKRRRHRTHRCREFVRQVEKNKYELDDLSESEKTYTTEKSEEIRNIIPKMKQDKIPNFDI
jgi:hypothetical protein